MEDVFVDVALTCCFKQLTATCEQGGGDKSRPSCVFLDVLLHGSWEHEETKTKIFPGFTRKEYSSMIFKWDNFVTPCKVSVKIMDKRFWLTASDYDGIPQTPRKKGLINGKLRRKWTCFFRKHQPASLRENNITVKKKIELSIVPSVNFSCISDLFYFTITDKFNSQGCFATYSS